MPRFPLSAYGEPAPAAGTVTLPGEGTACFTLTVEKPGLHRIMESGTGGGRVSVTVLDGGEPVACVDKAWGEPGWCSLDTAGVYTVKLYNRGVDPNTVTFAVVPIGTEEGCAPAVTTTWNSAPVISTSAGPTALHCVRIAARPGDRITLDASTVRSGQAHSWITDGTGARICPRFPEDRSDGCVLPGDGPYRVLSRVSAVEGGFPGQYRLTVRRISDP
ncbi:hypothetical protein DDE05_40120, partial [Streptomyces cavourensis]